MLTAAFKLSLAIAPLHNMFLDLFVGICLILYFQVFLSHSMAGGAGTSLSQLALHRVVRDLHDQCMLVLVGALSA